MALATETQRRSMFGHGVLPLVVQPLADGTVGSIDQKHFMGLMATIATQIGLQTDFVHIFSTGVVEPNHISDSGNNVLTAGDTEVQGDSYVDGSLNSYGGRLKNTSRYTTTQAIPVTDDQVYCNGTFTVTLPTGVDGQTFRIINSGTGTITITSAENIVGSTSDVTLNAGDVIILTFDTTDKWW